MLIGLLNYSSINLHLGSVYIVAKHWVADGLVFHKIDLPAKQLLQSHGQLKVVVGIVFYRYGIETDKEVNVTAAVELVCQDRTENRQLRHRIPTAEPLNLFYVPLNQ